MKRLIIAVFVLSNSILAFAGNPPEAVYKAFIQKFPNAQKVSWGKESKTEWEAEFTENGMKISANYSIDGQWLETETEITPSQLPDKIASSIKSTFPKYTIVGAARIESLKSGLLYEADIKTGIRKKEVLYKEDGTFVK